MHFITLRPKLIYTSHSRKGSYCGMATSPDTTASRRVATRRRDRLRDNATCDWTPSKITRDNAELALSRARVSVSVSVHILANNALLRILVCRLMVYQFFLNHSIELLEIMFDCRAFHSLAVVGKNYVRMCWTSV